MIQDFIQSWPLFQHAYLGGWVLAALLSLLGVTLIARDQIFFGAAVAQASTLGIAFALATSAWHPFGLHLHDSAWYPRACAIACSALAALGMELIAGRRESREAVTGFIFLVSSAGAMTVVAQSPFGADEVQRLLASSLIGARRDDVELFALLLAATIVLVAIHRDRLLLMAIDPTTARAAGVHMRAWSIGMACWLALVVGVSIRAAGLLYVFGCLLLPVLAAKTMVQEMRALFWTAPLLSVGCAMVGFILAFAWDIPPAPLTVVLMGALTLAGWAPRLLQRDGNQPSRINSSSR